MSRSVSASIFTAALVSLAAAGCGTTSTEGPASANPPPNQTPAPVGDGLSYTWQALTPSPGDLVLVDHQTRSTFNLRGEAIAGPLAAKKRLLGRVPSVNMFWFAWSVFNPGSTIWGTSAKVRAGTLPAIKTGAIACGGGADCIPSLPNTGAPRGDLAWTSPGASDAAYLGDQDLVVGVFHRGVARAYPHNVLWWHEVANDRIGELRFSVSFCPLTGSAVVWDAGARKLTFGVSGNIFNSNLIMYDHVTSSLWGQLWMGAVSGPEAAKKTWLSQLPYSEMTWARWRALHPETLILSERTGFSRDYRQYPYGDYRTDDGDTFRQTTPAPDPRYPNKAMVTGLVHRPSGRQRVYVHSDLAAKLGQQGVVNDSFGGDAVVVAYEKTSRLVLIFDARTPEGTLTFDAASFK